MDRRERVIYLSGYLAVIVAFAFLVGGMIAFADCGTCAGDAGKTAVKKECCDAKKAAGCSGEKKCSASKSASAGCSAKAAADQASCSGKTECSAGKSASAESNAKTAASSCSGQADCSCAKCAKAAQHEANLTTGALAALIRAQAPFILLDARAGQSDDGNRIPGAKQLSHDSGPEKIAAAIPTKDSLVVTYCGSEKCSLSKKLAAHLRSLGYLNVIEYPDGIAGWAAAGHEVMQESKHASAQGTSEYRTR
ncbi:MAG: rhodanese-like domain-containing protein [bacterium]